LILVLVIGSLHCAAQIPQPAQPQRSILVKGILLSADSSRPVPSASVAIKGTDRGVATGDGGRFELSVLEGTVLEFSSVGYKSRTYVVSGPADTLYQVQYLQNDTVYLGTTNIKIQPTAQQFSKDFVNAPVRDIPREIAKANLDPEVLRMKMNNLPVTTEDISRRNIQAGVDNMTSKGMIPPQVSILSLLNPKLWKLLLDPPPVPSKKVPSAYGDTLYKINHAIGQ
jgi:hypothetical protein